MKEYNIKKYTYVIVDDEQTYREQVKKLAEEFNQSAQKSFVETFGDKIELKLYAEHDGFNNRVFGDMEQADIVFLDLRFDGVEVGAQLLKGFNNAQKKNIIVLTNYKADYEKKGVYFPGVLAWLHKPISLKNLEEAVEKFHIRMEGYNRIYRPDAVEIVGRTGALLNYNDILFVKSSAASVSVYFSDFTEREFSANILAVRDFAKHAKFCQISSSCALNLQHGWTCYEDTREQGTHYAYLENLNQFRGLLEIDFRISHIYSRAIGQLPPRQR